eukprot:TRINITY_DN7552_c0_g1_i8.p2 TRINITY_DN7552_c0_g1~~TRINITY_DN7552_c0_g1_i8.p2  ORF type:complete len:155 (-),score=52.09 TRINITY_DN7552_c0_g1_i8:47-511(-)
MPHWQQYKGSKYRVLRTIFRCYISTVLTTCMLKFFCVVGELVTPFILQQIIDYLDTYHTEPLQDKIVHGFVILACLGAVKLTTSLVSQRVDMEQHVCGVQSMIGLGSIIYKKSLRLSNSSCKAFTQGKVLNLLQVDCMKAVSYTHLTLPTICSV